MAAIRLNPLKRVSPPTFIVVNNYCSNDAKDVRPTHPFLTSSPVSEFCATEVCEVDDVYMGIPALGVSLRTAYLLL